jgi:hypothetical protein
VLDGNQGISLAPDDQRRELPGEIEPVVGAHPLAAHVEDAAHGVEEGSASVDVSERDEALPYPLEIGACPQAEATEPAGDGADGAARALPAEQRQHDLGARERRRAQERMDLAPEAPARH